MDKTAMVTAGHEACIRTALARIDRVRCLLAMLSDITDEAEGIHLTGEAVLGFKQALLDAVNGLQDAREALGPASCAPVKLDRTGTGTASASGAG